MSADPGGILSYTKKLGTQLQAYSPLGDGTRELINGPLVSRIGAAHNKTGAQVSLRWVVKHGVPVSTKSTSTAHLKGDLDIFDWDITDAEQSTLDNAMKPAGHYSFSKPAKLPIRERSKPAPSTHSSVWQLIFTAVRTYAMCSVCTS